jgi:glycosyltransferase involved in cell wall biosynthesis
MSTARVKLTVALLTHNRANSYLSKAIQGIRQQTYRDFEFLILDNGSTDDTAHLVLSIPDSRIRYVRNPTGSSIEFNSVSGFHIATGERVIVTHDDDVMEPHMLKEQMDFLDEHPEVKLVWSNVRKINSSDQEIDPNFIFSEEARIFGPGDFIQRFALERIWPMPSTVMVERRLIATRYANRHYFRTTKPRWVASNHELGGLEDINLPALINTRHAIAFLDQPLLRYRVHDGQGTQSVDLSTPSIFLYRELKQHARKVRTNIIDVGLLDCHIAKHKLQKTLTLNTEKSVTTRTSETIRRLFNQVYSHEGRSPEALGTALPIYLACKLTEIHRRPMPKVNKSIPFQSALLPSFQAFQRWALAAKRDQSIFLNISPNKQIILFGSALVAALLIMDARLHERKILACIDSNIHRQNTTLLGIPIHPPKWLQANSKSIDQLILTSERENEPYLVEFLHSTIGQRIEATSWKALAASVTTDDAVLNID